MISKSLESYIIKTFEELGEMLEHVTDEKGAIKALRYLHAHGSKIEELFYNRAKNDKYYQQGREWYLHGGSPYCPFTTGTDEYKKWHNGYEYEQRKALSLKKDQ